MKLNHYTEYAGFGRRLLAMIIDSLWLLAIIYILLYLVYDENYLLSLESQPLLLEDNLVLWEHLDWQSLVINYVLPGLLLILFWLKYAATPGKLLFDCEIVDARTGHRITTAQAILRNFGYFLSALPFGLGFLWILWDRRKQGWHDKIARTVVIIHDESTSSLSELEQG